MEFRQLHYFIAVADEANLTAASCRLHVSQPPITRQIKQLEEELGARLFRRSSKGVQLTAAGVAFLTEARRLVQIAQAAREKCRAADRSEIGQLDVGYFGMIIHAAIPRAIRRFQDALPNVAVHIRRASKAEQYAQLRDGRLGVGFARHYLLQADLDTICVSHERLFVTSRVGHPLNPEGKPFSLSRLDGQAPVVFPRGSRPTFADQILDASG